MPMDFADLSIEIEDVASLLEQADLEPNPSRAEWMTQRGPIDELRKRAEGMLRDIEGAAPISSARRRTRAGDFFLRDTNTSSHLTNSTARR